MPNSDKEYLVLWREEVTSSEPFLRTHTRIVEAESAYEAWENILRVEHIPEHLITGGTVRRVDKIITEGIVLGE